PGRLLAAPGQLHDAHGLVEVGVAHGLDDVRGRLDAGRPAQLQGARFRQADLAAPKPAPAPRLPGGCGPALAVGALVVGVRLAGALLAHALHLGVFLAHAVLLLLFLLLLRLGLLLLHVLLVVVGVGVVVGVQQLVQARGGVVVAGVLGGAHGLVG